MASASTRETTRRIDMPELPEVERVRIDIEAAAQGKKISSVDADEDTIIFDGISSDEFQQALKGRRLVSCERRGKNFWLVLDGDGLLPVMHLGMTGRVLVKDQPGLEYQEGSKDSGEWPPRFMKFVLHFEDGTEIAFADPRRLGRIRLRADPLNEPPISQLGPDPIHAPPSTEDWHASVSHRRTNIKSVLLDQSVCAGVGNWVADEILFHARLHPMTVASTLSEEEIERVRVKMLYVVNTAVGVGADAKKFPGGWLMRHRWGKGKKKGEGEQFLLEDGTPAQVEFISIAGRTAAFVTALQPAPSSTTSKPKPSTSKLPKKYTPKPSPSLKRDFSSPSPPPPTSTRSQRVRPSSSGQVLLAQRTVRLIRRWLRP